MHMRKWNKSIWIAAAVAVLALFGTAVATAAGPNDVFHPMAARGDGQAARGGGSRTANLSYHGGAIGVETAPKVYIVFWGSQWNNNDPSGEAAYLQNFLGGLYGSQDTWSTSTTQYCQNVPSGTLDCTKIASAQYVGHPTATPVAGFWYDNGSAAPKRPTQSQLAAEAVKAAGHFGNTTSASNASVQYVIATSHGNSANGFGVQYCAWHSSTSSINGNIAYTNLPYTTDAGRSCGQNFVNSGSAGLLDGVSIVGGHEYTETITDQYPNGGWLDSSGQENADKCAWISSGQGAAANIILSGSPYAVQSLWSNKFNSGAGGCVTSYP